MRNKALHHTVDGVLFASKRSPSQTAGESPEREDMALEVMEQGVHCQEDQNQWQKQMKNDLVSVLAKCPYISVGGELSHFLPHHKERVLDVISKGYKLEFQLVPIQVLVCLGSYWDFRRGYFFQAQKE